MPGPFPKRWCRLRSWPTSSGGAFRRGWEGGLRARGLGSGVRALAAHADARHRCGRVLPRHARRGLRRRHGWRIGGAGHLTTAGPTPRHASSRWPTWPTTRATPSLKQLGATRGHSQLPPALASPSATPALLVDQPPLAGRENFAFAPYWTLSQSSTFPLTGLSTLAYFSIDVNPNGTLDESGSGWDGFQSQDLANLITRAHAAGERVVLTVTDFDQGSLDALTSSPLGLGALSSR